MSRSTIRSGVLAAAAVLGACLIGGCGSSGSPGTGRGTTASSGGGAPARTSSTGTTAGGSSLKVTGTPKFASPSASDPVRSGAVQVAYRNVTISPDTLRVKAGTTVRWRNFDALDHNVTSQSGPQRFASGNFGEGQGFAVKLTRPGTIHYECTIHPATMNGTIEVLR
jgi:plastocyanin